MGLNRATIKLIAESVKNQGVKGRLLIIGKQDVWASEDDVRRWLQECGITPANHKAKLSLKPYYQKLGFVEDTSVFKMMGFDEVVTLDYSAYEGADIVFDLNCPLEGQKAAEIGTFDLVLDSGCLEHIFNVPLVLKNFNLLTSQRGMVIHISPSSNHADHGFYMFSPTFFHDYYSANKWKIQCQYFARNSQSHRARWKVYHYTPGALSRVAFGGLKGLYMNYIAVQKQDGSTFDGIVQQGMYLSAWSGSGPPTLRERLKWYVPRSLIPFLQIVEARAHAFGGVGRYLKKYKSL